MNKYKIKKVSYQYLLNSITYVQPAVKSSNWNHTPNHHLTVLSDPAAVNLYHPPNRHIIVNLYHPPNRHMIVLSDPSTVIGITPLIKQLHLDAMKMHAKVSEFMR